MSGALEAIIAAGVIGVVLFLFRVRSSRRGRQSSGKIEPPTPWPEPPAEDSPEVDWPALKGLHDSTRFGPRDAR